AGSVPRSADVDDEVRAGAGGGDDLGVALVRAQGALPGGLGRAAVALVPGDEPDDAQLLVLLDVPALVEQRPHPGPVAVRDEQVVALGDDERHLPRHGDGAADRLLERAVEERGVDHPLVGRPQPTQERDVAERVEGVGGALAVVPAEPVELGLGEVEAVHADQPGILPQRLDELVREGRLPRAGSPGDAEDAPSAARDEGAGPVHELRRHAEVRPPALLPHARLPSSTVAAPVMIATTSPIVVSRGRTTAARRPRRWMWMRSAISNT